ncbi:hypothetical protein ACA910_004985 [Epithemia clementina (nom. ined.)]
MSYYSGGGGGGSGFHGDYHRGGGGGGGRPYDDRRGGDRGGRGFRDNIPNRYQDDDRSRSRGRAQAGGNEQRTRQEWEDRGLPVQANVFRLKFNVRRGEQTWFLYKIQINHSNKMPELDENGDKKKDANGNIIYGEPLVGKSIFDDRDLSGDTEEAKKKQERRNRASHISRRVIKKLEETYNLRFVSDGSSMAVSPMRLEGLSTEADDRPRRQRQQNNRRSDAGIYGPADTGGSAPAPEQDPIVKPWKVFPPIKIKKDCDEDDPEAYLSKPLWVQVKMTEVGEIRFPVNEHGQICNPGGENEGVVCQAINLAVHNAMLGRMLSLSTGPRVFFFKNDPRHPVYENLCRKFLDPRSVPMFGLLQSAKLTKNGFGCLVADLGLGWKKPETNNRGFPIKLLEPDGRRGGTLAGVRLEDLNTVIPEDKRREVEKALATITFHVRYECGNQWIEEMIKKMMGKPIRDVDTSDPNATRKKVRSMAKRGLRNKRMIKRTIAEKSEKDKKVIAWAANILEFHSFDFQYKNHQGDLEAMRPTTVAEYFKRRYDINLEFPYMPMVRISDKEYFPVEFLFQAQGPAKHNTEIDKDRVTRFALEFNDEFACTARIQEIRRLLTDKNVVEPLQEKLELLNLTLDTTPLEVRAKVLKMPQLTDGTGKKFVIRNGSWNLNERTFQQPATMHSFAVVNLTDERLPRTFPNDVIGALENHCVNLPFLGSGSPNFPSEFLPNLWNKLEVSFNSRQDSDVWRNEFHRAKQNARNLFLTETLRQGLPFRTMARIPVDPEDPSRGRRSMEVVVFPPELVTSELHIGNEIFGVMTFDHFSKYPSHKVTRHDGTQQDAWLGYAVDDGPVLPPSDIRFDGRLIEAFYDGRWNRVTSIQFAFLSDHNPIPPKAIKSHELLQHVREPNQETGEPRVLTVGYEVGESDIECPSLLYVILPEKKDSNSKYHLSKLMSYLELNLNSQTINMESFKRQKNQNQRMQYCSNIALKTNSKLATTVDKCCAWFWEAQHEDGTEDIARVWIAETPTLVIGLAKSSGQGQAEAVKMIVVGSGYLAVGGQTLCFEARAQSKSAIIDRTVIRSIVKNLVVQFYNYNGHAPTRIVLIRSGEHDGLFGEILDKEIKGVREGFLDAKGNNECSSCDGIGCRCCCPLITCLVAQGGGGARHNIRLAPTDRSVEVIRNNKNVPSGTCVDSDELLVPPNIKVKEHEQELQNQGSNDGLEVFESTNEHSSDFFLVPQGGLKGTSNGVLYRVILNENRIFKKPGTENTTALTKDILERLIYSLSFIYGKATKAPRDSALLKSADLLANIVHGIIAKMDKNDQRRYLPERESVDGCAIYGDSLLPMFGPYAVETMADDGMVVPEDAFRIHVLA